MLSSTQRMSRMKSDTTLPKNQISDTSATRWEWRKMSAGHLWGSPGSYVQ